MDTTKIQYVILTGNGATGKFTELQETRRYNGQVTSSRSLTATPNKLLFIVQDHAILHK